MWLATLRPQILRRLWEVGYALSVIPFYLDRCRLELLVVEYTVFPTYITLRVWSSISYCNIGWVILLSNLQAHSTG